MHKHIDNSEDKKITTVNFSSYFSQCDNINSYLCYNKPALAKGLHYIQKIEPSNYIYAWYLELLSEKCIKMLNGKGFKTIFKDGDLHIFWDEAKYKKSETFR